MLAVLPEQSKVLENASQSSIFIPKLRTLDLPIDTMNRIIEVYQKSFRTIWIVMTCFAAIGFLTSLFIKDLALEKDDIGRQGFEESE